MSESPQNLPSTKLNKEENRLLTFKDWNLVSTCITDPQILAQIGFFYTGSTDLVKCYFCDIEIGMWQPEDNPVDEHLRWSPNCPLLHGYHTTNDPIDADALKRILPIITYDICGIKTIISNSYPEISVNHPNSSNICDLSLNSNTFNIDTHLEFAEKSYRLASFKNWPKTKKQKPEELAEAGFFYTGEDDCVTCFSCRGNLKNWDETDSIWEQHARWYSNCDYLKLMKGEKYINEILTLCMFNKDFQKQENVDDSKICKICFKSDYNTVFIPCGHIVCEKCAFSLPKCSYCRQSFTTIMRVYFP